MRHRHGFPAPFEGGAQSVPRLVFPGGMLPCPSALDRISPSPTLGVTARVLAEHTDRAVAVSFSPDGTRLVEGELGQDVNLDALNADRNGMDRLDRMGRAARMGRMGRMGIR